MLTFCGVIRAGAQEVASLPAADYTLRVVNARGGGVFVRLGGDGPWAALGSVTQPATRTAAGFGASRWARAGSVAATAIHGIRIAIAGGEFGSMISLVPKEFAATPNRYGGHVPGDSGARTDIGAGKTLYKEWSPLATSPVFLETAGGVVRLPLDYVPVPGDVLLIPVKYPNNAPSEVDFENRKGGAVTAKYREGRSEVIGKVSQPVLGVGRFDGTSYTGIGQVNTNHPGVITVGTAPYVGTMADEGAKPERRGGFMFSPSRHVLDQAEGAAQVMGIAPAPGDEGWEGRFPLFGGAIGLGPQFHAQMQVDGGAWEDFPRMVGKDDAAFTAKGITKYLPVGRRASVKKGVTAVRLLLGGWDGTAAQKAFASAQKAAPKLGSEPTGAYRPIKGRTPVEVRGASRVTVLVDGVLRAAGNGEDFSWNWNTAQDANGRHWLEVRTVAVDGSVTHKVQRVYVEN